MLSKLFKTGSKPKSDSRVESRKSRKGESPYNSLHSRKKSDVEGKVADDIVMNDAERQLYKHELAEGEQDFGDLINQHERGQAFPYAAIIARPEENYDARVRRLQNMQPYVQSKKVDLPDYVNVKVTKSVEDFPLTEVFKVPTKGMKVTGYDYVCLKRVTMIFAPLSSFMDTHSDVIVSLVDMRKRTNNIARGLLLQDNKNYRGEFCLDYSFPKASIDKISLSFAQEVPTFMVGEQWGACQMYFDIEESTFPITHAFQETIGTLGATESMLQEYKFNPAVMNLAVRDSHLKKMRQMYLDNDILDETEAKQERTAKVSYASSSGAALRDQKKKQKKVEVDPEGNVDWSLVRSQPKADVPRDEVSIDAPEESEGEEDLVVSERMRALKAAHLARQREAIAVRFTSDGPPNKSSPPKKVSFEDDAKSTSSQSSGEVPITVGKFANLRLQDHQ